MLGPRLSSRSPVCGLAICTTSGALPPLPPAPRPPVQYALPAAPSTLKDSRKINVHMPIVLAGKGWNCINGPQRPFTRHHKEGHLRLMERAFPPKIPTSWLS